MRERLESLLISFFAVTALLMAGLGIYGVVSYSVRQRTVEIGTRMALGAISRDVFRQVVCDGLLMALWGILAGAVAVLAAALLLRSQVFGVHVGAALPFVYSMFAVAAFSAAACMVPAWRASLVSPMVAIRGNSGVLWTAVSGRISGLLQDAPEESSWMEASVMTSFAETARHAESFRQALELALANLARAVQTDSAQFLVKDPAGPFLCLASAGLSSSGGKVANVPSEGLLTGRLKSFPYPLPLDDLDAQARWAAAEHPEHMDEIQSLRESSARVAVPLIGKGEIGKGEITGILLLGAPRGRARYSSSDKHVLQNCAAFFALMLENARLTDRMMEQEKLRRDVQLAVEVQKRLFPDKAPESGVISLAGISIPARSVGGDYYDFLDPGNQTTGIALADVAGKGVAAALVMSVVQASLRVLASQPNIGLTELAAKMNQYLHRSTGTNSYATFFLCAV